MDAECHCLVGNSRNIVEKKAYIIGEKEDSLQDLSADPQTPEQVQKDRYLLVDYFLLRRKRLPLCRTLEEPGGMLSSLKKDVRYKPAIAKGA